MSTDPRLLPLAELLRLGLITSDEYDDTLAELEIIELQRAHNAAEDIDVPEVKMNADQIATLAWLLRAELVPEERFFRMLRKLPADEPRRQLASAALQQVNRQAVDALYQQNLINTWQRDAAHDSLPAEHLAATPVAALRHMLKQGTLSPLQYQELQARTRANGSPLARVIVDAAGKPPARYGRRAARPFNVLMIVLMLVLLMLVTIVGPSWFKREQPTPVAPLAQPVDTVERDDLRQRAAQALDAARQPGHDSVQYDVQVVQDKPPR
ncbi:hypothetical protein [Janthinobacterium sp. NKUCC06_STL]|uniref:hypothetical protein n=1 Tax=Janthinobacterium sp. NKUCC06_STL TaxID=2842127 RepID=UPI001C5ABBC0|nr:hypothetical protein [Janthinobacterium sp. NKUCC06_STL]MBW3508434.1 hypothetical protein [Janthinobacterium sp. NKUCC06_STL]